MPMKNKKDKYGRTRSDDRGIAFKAYFEESPNTTGQDAP